MLIFILTTHVLTSCSVTMMLFRHLEVKPLMTLSTVLYYMCVLFFFSSRRRHTRCLSDWSSDVCSSDLPDGKPLSGARSFNLNMSRSWDGPMKSAEFTGGFNPRRSYGIVVQHPETGLVGSASPPKQDGGSVAMKLQPGGAVTGRLVDAAGKPRPGVELGLDFHPKGWGIWHEYLRAHMKTDRDGRFRVEARVRGYESRVADGAGEYRFDRHESGKSTDLGYLRLKVAER